MFSVFFSTLSDHYVNVACHLISLFDLIFLWIPPCGFTPWFAESLYLCLASVHNWLIPTAQVSHAPAYIPPWCPLLAAPSTWPVWFIAAGTNRAVLVQVTDCYVIMKGRTGHQLWLCCSVSWQKTTLSVVFSILSYSRIDRSTAQAASVCFSLLTASAWACLSHLFASHSSAIWRWLITFSQ